MTDPDLVVRIAAKGDGMTADGRHVARAAPGDRIAPDGAVIPGPHHVAPACRHFGTCGGCQLQHADDAALAQFVGERVAHAAAGQGLEPARFGPVHLSPPASRRRAALHAGRINGRPVIGYREGQSHRLIDLAECPVLRPELFAMIAPLRAMLARQAGKLALDIDLTLADQGVDCAIKGLTVEGLQQTEAWIDFARDSGLARLTLDQGYGPEALWEPQPVTVTLSGTAVPLPPGAFLQATLDGEAALVGAAREWLAGAPTVADLFSGLGTFAFALAGSRAGGGTKVLAVEAARDAHLACQQGAAQGLRLMQALHRDLFRNPLLAPELDRFAAVLLDPPRAGAREQVQRIAGSKVPRVVYISCNPSSWSRDAALLLAGGYRLEEVRAVGQFRWSTHVELASLFVRN